MFLRDWAGNSVNTHTIAFFCCSLGPALLSYANRIPALHSPSSMLYFTSIFLIRTLINTSSFLSINLPFLAVFDNFTLTPWMESVVSNYSGTTTFLNADKHPFLNWWNWFCSWFLSSHFGFPRAWNAMRTSCCPWVPIIFTKDHCLLSGQSPHESLSCWKMLRYLNTLQRTQYGCESY